MRSFAVVALLIPVAATIGFSVLREAGEGRFGEPNPCFESPDSDECPSPSERRAWSSPIFLDLVS